MNILKNRKKAVNAALGAAAAAMAAPAMMFASAGTAQATTAVWPEHGDLGVWVVIYSNPNFPSSGWCTYSAEPQGVGLPVYGVPFHLDEGELERLWFPSIGAGTTRDVTVKCPNGGVDYHQITY